MTTERRHEPRVKTLTLVRAAEYGPGGLGEDTIGRTLDLSHDGMRLELDHCLPLRSQVRLSLAFGNQVVEVRGRIRSLREISAKTCEMGIEFEDVDSDAYEAFEEYLLLQSD